MKPDTSKHDRDEARGVGKRARQGLAWNLLGNAGMNVVRLVVIPILGRLLSPDEFGAIAAAVTVIAFGQMLRDIGIGAALVQKQELTREQSDAAVGFSMWLGAVLGVLTALTAPLLAQFFHNDDLVPMIRVLAVMFVIRAFGSVSRALCQREMRFRELSVIDFVAFTLGSVVSVVCAASGASVWAMIAGYLVESTIGTVAVFAIRPTPIHLRPSIATVKDLLGFGAGTTLADIAGYFANNGDYLVVGSGLGKQALGLYTRAYELMRFPSAVFTNVARFVLFSAFARLQNDRERLGRAFRRGTFLTAVLLLPTSAGLIVVAPEMVHVLLGNQWDSAILPFQILSVSMMARTAWKIGGTLARAAGNVYAVMLANVAYAVLVVVGALIGSLWGIVGVSIAIAIECTIHYLIYSFLGLRCTTLTWMEFALVHLEALLAAVITLAAIVPVAIVLRQLGAIDIVVLAGSIGAGALSLAVSLALGVRRAQADWLWLWNGVRARLSRLTRSARELRTRG